MEIDFGEVTGKKAMAIRKSKELSEVLGQDIRIGEHMVLCYYGTGVLKSGV